MSKNEPFAPWQCPLCGEKLTGDSTLKCTKGHCFDRAKEGYWHLLPVQNTRTKAPGDSREMVAARRAFLSAGYYGIFGQALGELCLEYGQPKAGKPLRLLDAGCGEGYYTRAAAAVLGGEAVGIDISKSAVRYAAKRGGGVQYTVAGSYHLPVSTGGADILLCCFSPVAETEFARVLSPRGALLHAVPAPDHLWELKETLYDSPYPNPEKETPLPGFRIAETAEVTFPMALTDARDIHNLFTMTPYRYKTPPEGMARLTALRALTVRAAFRVHVHVRREQGEELPCTTS